MRMPTGESCPVAQVLDQRNPSKNEGVPTFCIAKPRELTPFPWGLKKVTGS